VRARRTLKLGHVQPRQSIHIGSSPSEGIKKCDIGYFFKVIRSWQKSIFRLLWQRNLVV